MWILNVTCVCIQMVLCWCVSWKINLRREPVNMTYVNSFQQDSVITCLSYCISGSISPLTLATHQDGVCYCLSDMPLSNLEQILSESVIEKYAGSSECERKGYTVYEDLNICLKVNATPVNWTEADDFCHQDGGYLHNVNSDEKFASLKQFIRNHGLALAYVGGRGFIDDGFEWIRGGKIKEEYWNIGEPDNFKDTEYCVGYFQDESNAGLFDINCFETKPFICELML